HAIAGAVGTALVARGFDSWFFITVDYSYGYELERGAAPLVEQDGGKVLGRARHPLNAHDFGSYLARARESRAKVIGLANGGTDQADTIKEAARLGMLPGAQVFAGLGLRINAVHSLGLETTQGMVLSESFYWDLDEATRAWSKRFFERVNRMPSS